MQHLNRRRIATPLTALAVLALLAAAPASSQTPTGEEIMHMSNDRDQGQDFQSQVRLTSTDAQGNSQVLEVALVAKLVQGTLEAGKPRYRVRAAVTVPADSEGLSVLVHERDFPTPDDIWLFLPALGDTKKIVPENFRTPLFGSEFTFEELVDRKPGLGSHELLHEDELDGRQVWIVRSTPADPEVAGFAYRSTYVDQATLLQLRMELFDDFDTVIKRFTAERVETVDGVPTRVVSKAENFETGRTSTFEHVNPRYNRGGINDAVFEPANLGS